MVDLKRWSLEIVGKAGNWTESAGEALLENAGKLMDKAGNWTETKGEALLDNAGNWTKSAGGALIENTGEFINKAGNWTEATGGVILDNAGNFMEKAGNWTESTGGAIVENAEDIIGKTENWTEYVGDSFDQPELWPSDDKFFYMLIWVLLCGLIGIIGFPLSMIAIGFTVDGVTALSCAAITQGYVYGGATSNYELSGV